MTDPRGAAGALRAAAPGARTPDSGRIAAAASRLLHVVRAIPPKMFSMMFAIVVPGVFQRTCAAATRLPGKHARGYNFDS